MELENLKAATRDSSQAADKDVDSSARGRLVEEFFQSARSLDKDGNRSIDQSDAKAAKVTGSNSPWFSSTMDTVLSYKDVIDSSAGGSDSKKTPTEVSVGSLYQRQKESSKVLSQLDRSRNATSQLNENFDLVDSDNDGFISSAEVNKAHGNGKLNRATVGFLSKEFDSIEDASNDEWGSENNGITENDIEAVEFSRESSPKNIAFDGLAEHIKGEPALIDELIDNRFEQLDLNSDESLSRVEMRFATDDPLSVLNAQEKDLVNLLLEHDDVFEFKSGGEIEDDTAPLFSKSDLEEFSSAVEGRTFDQADLLEKYRKSNSYASSLNSAYNWGTGGGILAGATAGGAAGIYFAGPIGIVPGPAIGGLAGGIAGGVAGQFGAEAALNRLYNRRYEQVRLPALVSFREDYRDLRAQD